jgi:hypothetical protein
LGLTLNPAAGNVSIDAAVGGAVVINSAAADKDFVVHGSAQNDVLYVDAGNKRVGVNTAVPAVPLDVNGAAAVQGTLTVGDTVAQAQLHAAKSSSVGELAEVFRLTNPGPTGVDVKVRHSTAYVLTTNATATDLFSWATNTDSVTLFEIMLVGKRTGGAAGTANDSKVSNILASYKNTSGTVSELASPTFSHDWESQGGFNAAFVLTGANVKLQVTGAASNNMTWHAFIKALEVST